METDRLEARVGSSGEKLGAEVRNVSPGVDGKTIIDIALPLDNAERFDEVQVISEELQSELPQIRQHEWIEDYEKGHYGLRIYLQRNPRVGFRLRLMDVDDDTQRDR